MSSHFPHPQALAADGTTIRNGWIGESEGTLALGVALTLRRKGGKRDLMLYTGSTAFSPAYVQHMHLSNGSFQRKQAGWFVFSFSPHLTRLQVLYCYL